MYSVTSGWLGVGFAIDQLYWYPQEAYLGSFNNLGEANIAIKGGWEIPCCFHTKDGPWEWNAYGSSKQPKPENEEHLRPKQLHKMKWIKLPNGKEFLL